MLSQPSHLDFGVRGAVIFVAAAFAASAPSASAYEASGKNNSGTTALAEDTFDLLLKFLKESSGSPVSGVMELRSLLLVQKEEKILLRGVVDQMRVDLNAIRQQMKLHSSEIQIHAAEITRVRDELEVERSKRRSLEEREQRAAPPPLNESFYRNGATQDQSRMGQILDRALRRVSDLSDRQEREAVQLVDLKRSFDMHTAVQAAVKQDVQSINKGLEELKNLVKGQGGGNPSSTVRDLIEMRNELQEVKTQLEIFSKIASLGAAGNIVSGRVAVDDGTKQIYALSKSVAATKAAVDRVSARMGALEAELKSYTGAGGGSGGASTDAVRNLVYDTLPKILLMMSKFHDEIRNLKTGDRNGVAKASEAFESRLSRLESSVAQIMPEHARLAVASANDRTGGGSTASAAPPSLECQKCSILFGEESERRIKSALDQLLQRQKGEFRLAPPMDSRYAGEHERIKRGLRLAGEELRNITSGVSRLSGEVGRLKTAAEPIIRLDKERPLAPTLDQLKGAVANLESLQGKKMAGFENDLLAMKNDHNALAAKLNGMLYLKADVRSLAEASAAMVSEFRARQAESMENMRQMMEIISRGKPAVVHRDLMANVTAIVNSLRAEEGIEVSRLASVVAAMEKGLEALQNSSVAKVPQQNKTAVAEMKARLRELAGRVIALQNTEESTARLSGAEFKSVVESIAQLQGRINDIAHNLDGRTAQKENELKSRMFVLEAELRKASETTEAKARSQQEAQRALAALVARLKAEIESNLRTDEVVARRVDGMWARTEGKIGELRMQLEHGLRAIVAQQARLNSDLELHLDHLERWKREVASKMNHDQENEKLSRLHQELSTQSRKLEEMKQNGDNELRAILQTFTASRSELQALESRLGAVEQRTTSSSTSVAGQLRDFNGRAENLHKALQELKHISLSRKRTEAAPIKIERYDVPREETAAARNLSELVRETCESEVQKVKKEVFELSARLSQHSRAAEERMRNMDDATRRTALMASAAPLGKAAEEGADISVPAGSEGASTVGITRREYAIGDSANLGGGVKYPKAIQLYNFNVIYPGSKGDKANYENRGRTQNG